MTLSPTEINVKSKIGYFLRPIDVAFLMGVSVNTVRRAIKAEKIPAKRIGRGLFIHPDFISSGAFDVLNNAKNNATNPK